VQLRANSKDDNSVTSRGERHFELLPGGEPNYPYFDCERTSGRVLVGDLALYVCEPVVALAFSQVLTGIPRTYWKDGLF
jgi:hypothetical protein